MQKGEREVKEYVLSVLRERYQRLGFKEKYLITDFDIVKSGILDSLSFIELIVTIEEHYSIRIDLEDRDPSSFTKLSGLVKLITEAIIKHENTNN